MTAATPESGRKITDILARDEVKQLTARSDLMGAWAVASTWAIIAAAFALLAWGARQRPALAIPAFVVGLAVIGGRQLCLGILMHDASHGSLFKSKWLNRVLADWTCARPLWNDLAKYRVHHFEHHRQTGSDDDTDLSLVRPFPCSRASLARKLVRDLVGLTGLKLLAGRLLMDLGYVKWTIANDVVKLPPIAPAARLKLLIGNATPTVVVNALLFAALYAAGHPWLYVAWVAAYVAPFSLFVRIRSMAEHACMEMTTDLFRNTRSTRAGWLARATVAPLRVNFHLEHHALTAVPYYRLARMHQLLRERGAVPPPPSYLAVLRLVSSGD